MSEIYEIADAVAAALNAAPFAASILPNVFTATRQYVPLIDIKSLAGTNLKVLVVPKSDDLELITRDSISDDVSIDVGIIKRLTTAADPTDPAANAEIDPLVKLCRQIAKLYLPSSKAGDAVWHMTKYAPIFDSERLRLDRTFVAVVTYTFEQAQ